MAAAAAAASAGNNGSPLYNDFSLSADLFATRPWTALNTLCATSATDPYSIERAAKLYRNAASQWNSLMSVCLALYVYHCQVNIVNGEIVCSLDVLSSVCVCVHAATSLPHQKIAYCL